MYCFFDAEWSKKMHSSPAEPLLHKKTLARPLYHIFTSSPISTRLKKPIFKEKMPSNSSQYLETSNHSEQKEKHQISSPQKTEAACLKQGAPDNSSEIKVEQNNVAPEPSTVTTPPSCESEPPSAANPDEDEEDEDQTIFFTPELFEDEGSPKKGTKPGSECFPRRESPALLSEELFGSEQAQGQVSAFDGQSAISVSKETAELSQGQKEGMRGQKQGEEGEQVDSQSRQADSRLRRLSRSRQKAPSTPTGN